ncbi:MAG: hypothetical protein EON55_03615 [Alphaproteobacteria bacterium]|nr:MAG: hypothetical protein EON55_03615 [Alphaproteobacteria bacterium]
MTSCRATLRRRIVVTLIGSWLLLGAAPPANSSPSSQREAGKTVVTSGAPAEQPDRSKAPCVGKPVDRESELCAQWVSADAAEASARFAGHTFWAGLATLLAAIAAAGYAATAARAARDTLRHERSLILPRFQITAELRVFAGSNNVLRLTLCVVGDNPARALVIEELTYEKGALGARQVLEQVRSDTFEDSQTFIAEFRPPGMAAGYVGREQVEALVGEEVALVASWCCRDVSGALRATDVALRGRFVSRSDPGDRALEIAAIMSGTTFDRSI